MNSKTWKLCIIMAVVAALGLTYIAFAEGGNGGTGTDPLVTVSYLNEQFDNFIKKYSLDTAGNSGSSNETDDVSPYAVPVQLKKGQILLADVAGVEVSLRRGEANVVGVNESEGLVNYTKGTESFGGEALALQNLYLIPRADGRGIIAVVDSWVMVKGNFKIIDKDNPTPTEEPHITVTETPIETTTPVTTPAG